MKILLADDEPLELQNLEKMLTDLGDYELFTAENGLEAIELLRSHTIDLVFLDIKMPGKNGLDVLEEIECEWPNTIVSIISAFDDFMYAQKAIELGAIGYLLKPFTDDEFSKLFSKMKELYEKKQKKKAFVIQSTIERSLFSNGDLSKEEALANLHFFPEVLFVMTSPSEKWIHSIIQTDSNMIISPQQIDGFSILLTISACTARIKDQILLYNLSHPDQILYGHGESDSMKVAYAQAIQDYHERNRSTFNQFLHYMKENYYKNLTLADAANVVHVSSSHLNRLLKKEYGKTFTEILLDIRIEKAKELLLKSYNVEVVSDMVGFNSAAYFAVCFKKLTGVSPSRYRNEVG